MFKHAGVCRLYEVMQSPLHVYLVMEKGDRDLYAFLDDYPEGCDEGVVKSVTRILALALRHCHRAGVAHRDVKPENVLVVGTPEDWSASPEEAGIVKLCDFGLCAKITLDSRLTDFVGSRDLGVRCPTTTSLTREIPRGGRGGRSEERS